MLYIQDIKQIKAIFIDFDGTLVDSIPGLFGVYQKFLKKLGKEPTEEEFHQLNGLSMWEVMQKIRQNHSLKHPLPQLIALASRYMMEYYANPPTIFSGVKEFFELAKDCGWKLAIVTSSTRKVVDKVLKKNPILKEAVSHIITSDGVENGKPHPEIYQKALKILDVEPDHAIAIEDSSLGVKAALSAGIPTLCYFQKKHLLEEFKEERVQLVQSWESIIELLECPFKCEKLSRLVNVSIDETFNQKLCDEEKQKVESYWKGIKENLPKAFNGNVFCINPKSFPDLKGSFYEYKIWAAQTLDEKLQNSLDMMLLGVQGIIKSKDQKVLLAKRSKDLFLYPDHWEFAPAGVVDDRFVEEKKIDLEKMIKEEFKEETKIGLEEIETLMPKLLLKDKKARIWDVVFEIRLKNNADYYKLLPNREYSAFCWVTFDTSLSQTLVPSTKYLINHEIHSS